MLICYFFSSLIFILETISVQVKKKPKYELDSYLKQPRIIQSILIEISKEFNLKFSFEIFGTASIHMSNK